MSYSKFTKSIYKSFYYLKNGYKFFYITFESSNVNETISYSGHLLNKILDLITCNKFNLFSN
jgi:hypothetical protein